MSSLAHVNQEHAHPLRYRNSGKSSRAGFAGSRVLAHSHLKEYNLHMEESKQNFRNAKFPIASTLSDVFLSQLIAELDNDAVTAIVLSGSYARGDATPYSDVDLILFVREPDQVEPKRFLYRGGYLVSIATNTISHYHQSFTIPEQAIFSVPNMREAHILLDKEEAFSELQCKAREFIWEPLQPSANIYADTILMEYIEYTYKILRALFIGDELALSEMIAELLIAVTDALAVQRGVLVAGGNTYFLQAQEAAGVDSQWTLYHRLAAGVDMGSGQTHTLEARGFAALRLYQETAKLLQTAIRAAHWEVVEQAMKVVNEALAGERA